MAWYIGGVWEQVGAKKKPWLSITRELNAALRAIKFDPKQRRQKNVALIFNLAQWLQRRSLPTPKKTLAEYFDHGDLFDILKIHDEVPDGAYGFCDLTKAQINQLEKRLWHHWPAVTLMLNAMNAPSDRLRAANNKRRNPVRKCYNPRQQVLSALLTQLNS